MLRNNQIFAIGMGLLLALRASALSVVLLSAAAAGLAGPAPIALAAQTLSISNTADIAIPVFGTGTTTGAPASPYPSQIQVSGFAAGSAVNTVRVTLSGLSHTRPADIDIMLVAPDNEHKAIIFSDIGGSNNVNDVTITLDDAANHILPDGTQLSSGTYQPRNIDSSGVGDPFPAPAPVQGPSTPVALASFSGADPNGTWKLFVVDDASGDTGVLSGWSLEITSDLVPALALPSPGPTYHAGGPPVLIDPAATVSDSDSPNFDTGEVTVDWQFPGGSPFSDQVTVRNEGNGPGQIGFTLNPDFSGSVTFGGTLIGVSVNNNPGSELPIELNSAATPAAVQALVRNLIFLSTTTTPATGPRLLTITVSDGDGGSTAANTTLTVVSDPPVAVDDAYGVNNGATLTVPAATGVLANDTDADTPAGSLQAQVVTSPQHGTLSLQVNGAFTYAPRADFAGADAFTYRVVDPQNNVSAPATATITVNPVACGPRPSVTVATTTSGGALQATVTANDVTGPTGNRLIELRFGQFRNAQVSLTGQPIVGGQTVALPAGTTTATFTVRRATPGQATTVPLTVVDVCGPWPTFVGGGVGAGF